MIWHFSEAHVWRRRSWKYQRRGAGAGFTLVEVLVVLAIAALAMVAVPQLIAGLPGIRLRIAADDMVLVLKGLRDEAMRQQVTTEIVIDRATRVYRVSTRTAAQRLPEVVGAIGFTAPAIRSVSETQRIRFFADGSASGGTIRLVHGGLSQSITVDWLTGRVRRYD